jgi:lysophospholipase L1-like esterase
MINCIEKNNVLSYTALGDSLTLGVGTFIFSPGFVDYYTDFIEEALNQYVALQVIANSGATTSDVLNSLKSEFVVENIINSEIITITAGGNDLINGAKDYIKTKNDKGLKDSLEKCKRNMSKIMTIIKDYKSSSKPYIVRIVNLYNPLPDIKFSDYWVDAFNDHLGSFSGEYIKIANIRSTFKGNEDKLLSYDKIHPNEQGYFTIANALNELGYDPLC